MKIVILAALLAVALALPADPKDARILKSNSEFDDSFKYQYDFESDNGIKIQESGNQKQVDPEDPESFGTVSRGSYTYEWEGVTYTVNWVADENGFRATGAHLPVAPVA